MLHVASFLSASALLAPLTSQGSPLFQSGGSLFPLHLFGNPQSCFPLTLALQWVKSCSKLGVGLCPRPSAGRAGVHVPKHVEAGQCLCGVQVAVNVPLFLLNILVFNRFLT